MSARDWLRAVWAEWAPEVSRGRIGVGLVVLMTRAELMRTAWEHHDIGAHQERTRGRERRQTVRAGRRTS